VQAFDHIARLGFTVRQAAKHDTAHEVCISLRVTLMLERENARN
jgi:hypothetical protein